jgi:hypothetical protein
MVPMQTKLTGIRNVFVGVCSKLLYFRFLEPDIDIAIL